MIKLVVSDLDGTLIPEGTQDFEPGFFEALDELLERGYEFYAASGRQYVNMYEKFGAYADRIGYLSDNGALAMKGRERLFVEEIKREFALEVSAYAQSMKEVDILVSGVEDAYFFPKTEWFKDHILNVYGLPAKMPRQLSDIEEPIIKLSMNITDFDQNAQKVKQRLTERYGEFAEFVSTGNGWIDMIVKGSGKGKALNELSRLKDALSQSIMTFGDNQNDISMLKATPNSYAKTNAAQDVKDAAVHTCESVIEVLRKELLK